MSRSGYSLGLVAILVVVAAFLFVVEPRDGGGNGRRSEDSDERHGIEGPIIDRTVRRTQTASVRGFVRDASTNAPLSGARLRMLGPLGGRTSTDANGAYEFKGLPDGDYRIRCESDGYEPRTVYLAGLSAPEAHVADLSLRRAAAVRVTAVDAGGRFGQGRLYLRLNPVDTEGPQTERTVFMNHEGASVLRNIAPGRYFASLARTPGGGSQATEISVEPGENEVRLEVAEGPVLLKDGAALFGKVSDATTGQPIAGVRVWSPDNLPEQFTNTEGEFALRRVPSGPHSVIFEKFGYVSQRLSRPAGADGRCGVNVSLEPACRLLIQIVDASDQPVRERVCIIRELGGQEVSELVEPDDNGRVVYNCLGAGTCRLGVVAASGGRSRVTVNVTPKGENSIVVRLR